MRLLSEAASRITGKSFSRKYVALGRIVNSWEDIVGAELAGKAQPVKINYRKPAKKGEKPHASLDIAVSSAGATLLHYQKDLILERINQIFGDKWISAVRFVNMPASHSPARLQKPRRSMTADQKNTLSELLLDIKDEDIKARLEKLGTAVLEENQP